MSATTLPEPSSADHKRASKQTASKQTTGCHHCGLAVPQGLVDETANEQFCCMGCRVAYETIHGCGLEAYYGVRDRMAGERLASTGAGERYVVYDSEPFLAKHAQPQKDGLMAIDLRLEGVHCAACVWLIEHLPRVVPGVIEARLSLASSSAKVTWDPQQIQLSQVAAGLDRLGYAPHPSSDVSKTQVRSVAERKQLIRMAIAGALAGNNMLIALALYAGAFDGIQPQFVLLFRWLSLAIGWLSLVWPGRDFFRGAWSGIKTRTANLDLPISLALAVGAIAGTGNVLLNRGDIYFDSLSVLVFLLLTGRYIQARQQRWAEESIGLMLCMTPSACRVLRNGIVQEESVDSLVVGDLVEVRAGELFPADGVIQTGESSVDQSLLTGESLPQPVQVRDAVFAGAQNVEATLRVTVTAAGESTRVAQLMRLVDEGLHAKAPIVQFADRVAGWFVLVIGLLALANFVGWTWLQGLAPAIDSTVALLIVACPCALGLATPLTMAIAIGRASRQGILVKTADVMQRLGRVVPNEDQGRLLLDKTGTLTEGTPRLVAWHGDTHVRPYVASIEAESNHPVARVLAIPEDGEADESYVPYCNRSEHHGFGVSAECSLGLLRVGSPRWIGELELDLSPELAEKIDEATLRGLTSVVVAINDRVVAICWLADNVHPDANDSLRWLQAEGWTPEILSGDNRGAVTEVALSLGIDADAAHGEMSPEQKLAFVRQATQRRATQRRATQPTTTDHDPVIVMVGDGVNDAAALAAADVGIAVHGGAEAALAAADVYISQPGIGAITDLMRLARRTMQVAHRNLAISLMYNSVAVGLAVAGYITPLVAAVLMPISSVSVLASAIVGLRAKRRL